MRRLRITILDRYVFLEILRPFLVFLLFFTTLFISIALKDVLGDLLSKGVDPLRVAQFLCYLLLEKLVLTLPAACLFGGILATGRLSSESEITAMRAAGISFPRIYIVFVACGVVAAAMMMAMNFWIGPWAASEREEFQEWIQTYHSLTMVQAGRFLGRGDQAEMSGAGQDIYAEERDGALLKNLQVREWYINTDVSQSETVSIRGVQAKLGDGFITRVLHAREGQLLSRRDGDGEVEVFLRATNGYMLEVEQKSRNYRLTDFSSGYLDYVIPPPVRSMGRLNVRPDNYRFGDLFDMIDKLENGGFEIDPIAIIASANSDLRDYNQLPAAGDESPLANRMGKFVLPSVEEMERMSEELQLKILNPEMEMSFALPEVPGFPPAMLAAGWESITKNARTTLQRFRYEVHLRTATPVACLLFFFVSFPLGLVVRRSGRGASFVLALAVFAAYYAFLMLGQDGAYKGYLPAAFGAWLPVALLALAASIIMALRTDGFNPFQGLATALRRQLARRRNRSSD